MKEASVNKEANSPLRYEPDYAVPPGVTLGERLADLDMDQRELSKRLDLSPKCVNQIIQGKAPITQETAIKLERVTGVPALVWNNLEMNYRAGLARIADQERLQTRANMEWLKMIPTKELVSRGVFQQPSDELGLLRAVLDFFGVASPEDWVTVWKEYQAAASWRKSSCFEASRGATATWLRLGEREAQGIDWRGPCIHSRNQGLPGKRGRPLAGARQGPDSTEPAIQVRRSFLVFILPRSRARSKRPKEVHLHRRAGARWQRPGG
jgi:addiction module HigA family antidote